jgi:hypothetical protein
LDLALDDRANEAALRAIDDALYGVMMIIDGVEGRRQGRLKSRSSSTRR